LPELKFLLPSELTVQEYSGHQEETTTDF
jgi:hypothetical protein